MSFKREMEVMMRAVDIEVEMEVITRVIDVVERCIWRWS